MCLAFYSLHKQPTSQPDFYRTTCESTGIRHRPLSTSPQNNVGGCPVSAGLPGLLRSSFLPSRELLPAILLLLAAFTGLARRLHHLSYVKHTTLATICHPDLIRASAMNASTLRNACRASSKLAQTSRSFSSSTLRAQEKLRIGYVPGTRSLHPT